MATPRRILVDHHGNKGIGDVVCELSYYRALRERYPEAELSSRRSRTLAWGHPFIDTFDETSPEEAFDLVIKQPSMRAIAADLRTALDRGDTIFDLFLKHQGFEPLVGPPELFVLPDELEAMDLGPRGDRLLIAYSADSKEPDRRWGQERFQALARHLEAAHGARMVEIGSALTEGHLGVGQDLVGRTTLRETLAVLFQADAFVGNNGGLTHLAGGLGTPVLVPWGANSPYEAYAYDEISVAVGTAPACRNCGWTQVFNPVCLEVDPVLGRTPCTQEIAVADMIEAADELMADIRAHRDVLAELKRSRLRRARDPRSLRHFEREGADPYTHRHLSIGGHAGWFQEHHPDHFRRLKTVVAFPDWSDESPESAWRQVVSTFLELAPVDSPWTLMLTAAPLTGPEVRDRLERFLAERHTGPAPKILVRIGSLGLDERQALAKAAELYLPLSGPFQLPEQNAEAPESLCARLRDRLLG